MTTKANLDTLRRLVWSEYVGTMDEALDPTNTKEQESELYSLAADLFLKYKELEADYLAALK